MVAPIGAPSPSLFPTRVTEQSSGVQARRENEGACLNENAHQGAALSPPHPVEAAKPPSRRMGGRMVRDGPSALLTMKPRNAAARSVELVRMNNKQKRINALLHKALAEAEALLEANT